MDYYDGTKLMSLRDINGNIPEIYMVTSNRTAGKTTFFSRMAVKKYKECGEKFAVLYRYNYELDDCAETFFKDIQGLFFPTDEMTSERKANGIYHELFLNGKSCGYAISINSADAIKRKSHLFSDVVRILFDEFQTESGKYCDKELIKFQSVHTSIARGKSKQYRYVPVYMMGNPVTLLNPYYIQLGISDKIKQNTHFLRGDGFVLEQGYNASASKAQSESAFNRAFTGSSYANYGAEGVYLNDNYTFVEEPKGNSHYICTIRVDGVDYAVRRFTEQGIIYCNTRVDKDFKMKISATTDDHQINYVMLEVYAGMIKQLQTFFRLGCFRFKDLRCKSAIIKALSL